VSCACICKGCQQAQARRGCGRVLWYAKGKGVAREQSWGKRWGRVGVLSRVVRFDRKGVRAGADAARLWAGLVSCTCTRTREGAAREQLEAKRWGRVGVLSPVVRLDRKGVRAGADEVRLWTCLVVCSCSRKRRARRETRVRVNPRSRRIHNITKGGGGAGLSPGELLTLSKPNPYPESENTPAPKLFSNPNLCNPLGRFDGVYAAHI